MKRIYMIILLIFILFITGCGKAEYNTSSEIKNENTLTDICIQACKDALSQGKNLDNGPCLLNPIKDNPKWVCDIAHNPRTSIDNIQENQCSSFREGKVNRFIEVTPDCKSIR